MTSQSKQRVFNKTFVSLLVLCLLSFLFPALRISLGGQVATQYLLTSYPGWFVFGVLIIYTIIQGIIYYRKNKWNSWSAMVIGLFAGGFGISILVDSFSIFDRSRPNSLVQKLGASVQVLTAPWLLATGGIGLFILALIKIIEHQRAITAG